MLCNYIIAVQCITDRLILCRQKGAQSTDAPHVNTSYRLHGVVCHTGNLLGGHYMGYVRYHCCCSWLVLHGITLPVVACCNLHLRLVKGMVKKDSSWTKSQVLLKNVEVVCTNLVFATGFAWKQQPYVIFNTLLGTMLGKRIYQTIVSITMIAIKLLCVMCRCGEHWYQFDDARVTLVPEEYVRMSNAYMLFYLQQ